MIGDRWKILSFSFLSEGWNIYLDINQGLKSFSSSFSDNPDKEIYKENNVVKVMWKLCLGQFSLQRAKLYCNMITMKIVKKKKHHFCHVDDISFVVKS